MTGSLIARKREKDELIEAYKSKRAEFIVLYGRRRIGKTFLIEELYGSQPGYYFQATGIQNGSIKEQLHQFAREIGASFYHGAHIKQPESWMEALEALTQAINNTDLRRKVVIFIDELPWFCTKRSRMLQALDYYWNRHWKRNQRIKLVTCGSSASWIIKKLLHHRGGLHNRNTRTILLKPFTLSETRAFFQHKGMHLTLEQIIQIYSFCGGVPHYLEQIKKGRSAAQMIDQLCFQTDGMLFNEFSKLFSSLFENAETYEELIQIIAKKNYGVSRSMIEKQSKYRSGGTLSTKLQDLEDAGFIQSFIPLGNQSKGRYYRIADEYCHFYLRWIQPIKSSLVVKEQTSEYWSHKINTPSYNSWLGYAFESICYKHISQIRQALGIPGNALAGTWRYVATPAEDTVGTQIDLLFDREDGVVNLCEIKYTSQSFTIDKNYAANLRNKVEVYQKKTKCKKQIVLSLVAANGVTDNAYKDIWVDQVITLEDLFDT